MSASKSNYENTARAQIARYRLQGYRRSRRTFPRSHMEPDLAAMVLESLGLSLSDLKQAEADPYVLEALQ
jgi:hypothetical protein